MIYRTILDRNYLSVLFYCLSLLPVDLTGYRSGFEKQIKKMAVSDTEVSHCVYYYCEII